MKIRIKLLAGILLLFLISQGISMAVLYSVQKDYEITARNQEILLNDGREKRFYKQVNTIPGQDKKPMEQETMLISVFRRNMGGTAALYQGEREVYNRTPYEFSYEKTKVYIEKKTAQSSGHALLFPVIINGKTLQIEYSETEIWGEKYQIYQVSDLSFIKENIKKNARKGMAVSGLVVMFGGALLYLLLKRMLSPLETLTVASKALSEGNYKERVRIKADGEIGILAEQFNGMADKIEEKMENLHAMNEQQLRLIGSLSHEIKTPMTAIGGYTQMLRYRSDLKPEQKEKALMYMDSECRRLSSLAGKMMELCGLYEEKKIKVKEENVYSVVGECLEKMAFRMKEAGVSAEILTENKEIAYPVDRDLFTSYVWNILENAVRASSIGGKIRIFIEEDSLSIADEGIGIPAKDLDKVQEAFYMVEKSRSRKEGGAGLGLALCQQIAGVHGASMEIESSPGEGTKVIWRKSGRSRE